LTLQCIMLTLTSGTQLKWDDLVHGAFVFPYLEQHVVPLYLWINISTSNIPTAWFPLSNLQNKWAAVVSELSKLVPGVSLDDLALNISTWWTQSLSLATLGSAWEKLVAASLAAKYKLLSIANPTTDGLKLSQLYEIDKEGQAFKLLDQTKVDLQYGVICPDKEVLVGDAVEKAVNWNKNIQNAHHDLVLYGPTNVAVQCKNSFNPPDSATISRQLDAVAPILWFYLGAKEDEEGWLPKKFRTPSVVDAIAEQQIGFLSGAGCASSLSIDLVLLLKKLTKKLVKIL